MTGTSKPNSSPASAAVADYSAMQEPLALPPVFPFCAAMRSPLPHEWTHGFGRPRKVQDDVIKASTSNRAF